MQIMARPEEGIGSPREELGVVSSYQMWLLGNELGFSGRAVSTVNFPAISPALGQALGKCLINKQKDLSLNFLRMK